MSQSELVAQCVNFFVAGFDANVAALGHASYMMALHPDKQERVHQELVEALEKTNGELTYEALQSLKYMDSFISETFRILPAAVKIERECAQDYALGETGITIPKGMLLSIPVYCIHRDPEWFPDPEKFDPER
ncbi:cytochrome P450 9e2 [Caerostris extrusa]|uniref:Cytochrome P450 9e2 n=1 Tax=Caerostris extrusa TaxID=172846 RepID=A0AAV4NJE2_CAEEX|nr:cytochrome P450 9e2 [Caerostris extrusa]